MGDIGRNLRRAAVHQGLGGVAEGAAAVDDVVEQHAAAALDVTDDVGHLALAGAGAALVDNGQFGVQAAGHGQGADHPAHIRRHDHQLVRLGIVGLHVVGQQGRRQQVVGGDVEEALNLARVQVHGQDPVGAGAGDQVGDQLGGDRRAAAGLPILTGIAEIGHHRCDPPGRGAFQRIDADQQLHQIVVGGVAGRLDDEDILAADILVDGHPDLVVGEPLHLGLGQGDVEMVGDGLGESLV